MKKLLILSILLISLSLTWCWSDNSYTSDTSSTNCEEPSNPYGDWWWHDAWFNRAEENWWDCDWNSDSFNEWCEEYYSQLEEYENCKN